MHSHRERVITVLVHGLWYGPVSMLMLARRLRRAQFTTRLFRYPTVRRGLSANARALGEWIDGLDAERVNLVGHSLGGLVILRALTQRSDLPPGKVVLMGSPVRGSRAARRLAASGPIRPLLGRAREALDVGFDRAPPGRRVGVIAGNAGMGLGRLVRDLDQPSDGTIAVSETRLPGCADAIELPVSHTGLVLSPAVADQVVAFLRSGRFQSTHGLQS